APTADERRELLECVVRRRKKALQVIEERGRAPEKHSRVPQVCPGGGIPSGQRQSRLFRESPNRVRHDASRPSSDIAPLDIAVSRFGPRRRNSEDNEVPRLTRQIKRGADQG